MIVAIPACAKDAWLAERNLEWLVELKQSQQFDAVLCLEGGVQHDVLVPLAQRVFRNARLFTYDVYRGDQKWPKPQNYAWQSAARHLALQSEPWFWWEPDVTPLRANWLELLDAEYRRSGKPFMGHITSMSWMNGVAVYPPDVARHSQNALLCREAAWDVTLWADIREKTWAANHLIGHFPRYTQVQVTMQDSAVARRLLDKGYACFHGCNDGSLIDLLLGKPSTQRINGAQVRLFEAPDVDEVHDDSEAFYQRDAEWMAEHGFAAPIPFSECRKPMVSFALQSGFPAGFFPLPHNGQEVHFNPGLVRHRDKLWLVTRRWTRQGAQPWRSSLVAWTLDDQFLPSNPVLLRFPRDTGQENYEDPRVVFHMEQFHVACGIWRMNRLYRAHQGFTSFDTAWQPRTQLNIPYGGNGFYVGSGTGHEKNWTWFWQDGAWHIVYLFQPHTVLRVEGQTQLRKYETTLSAVPWRYGDIHGGSPPIRLGDEYVSFFHSSLAWRARQKRYYTGAYAFSVKAPFKVTRITPEPIVRGSENDPRILGGPLVTLACGALLERDEWLVTLGINDETCGWIRIPVKALDKLLKPV